MVPVTGSVVVTKQERVYRAIRERILSGAYGPGYRVVIDTLAEEFDTHTRSAVSVLRVVRCDAAAAETTIDRLYLDRLAADLRRRCTEADLSGHYFFKMNRQRVAHGSRGGEAILRLVFNRAHQNLFHLSGYRWRYLTRPRIFLEVEN